MLVTTLAHTVLPPANDPVNNLPRVYIVDDDAGVRAALSMLVETCGWEAIAYASAGDFFSNYVSGANQCLILDLHMPWQNGLAVQSELARRGHNLPIILVTAHSDRPEAQLAKSRGIVAMFSKPFDSDELLKCLQRTLNCEIQEPRRKST